MLGMLKILICSGVALTLLISELAFGNPTKAPEPLFLRFEERAILSYLLAGVGQSDEVKLKLAERLKIQLTKYIQSDVQSVEVETFEDYLKVFRGSWPDSYSLTSDLALLERGSLQKRQLIKAKTPELEMQIAAYQVFRKHELKKRLGPQLNGVEQLLISGQLLAALESLKKKEQILRVFAETEKTVQDEFRNIESVGTKVASSGKLSALEPTMKIFMQTIFEQYFAKMSVESKSQIISRLLGEDLNSDPMKKFEVMILSGGPQFQKLLQVVAREAKMSPDLLEVFRKLESKAAPIPPALVQQLFEAERATYNWVWYDTKPLGTGTMAQVHRGKIRTEGRVKDVVIRFLKPEIASRVEEDHRILSEIAPLLDSNSALRDKGFPRLVPVISDLTKTIREELDLQATITRQQQGRQAYHQDLTFEGVGYKNILEISVPNVYMLNSNSNLMVQELVRGDKLDNVSSLWNEVIPDFKRVLVEEIAKVWVEEVFFKTGFYHADLHQGNFMVDLTDQKISVSILDFGMGGTISRDLQRQVLQLGAGLEILKASAIAHTFWQISDKSRNQINAADFEARVQAMVDEIRSGKVSGMGLNRWSSWAMDQGIQFPYEFVGLNRGAVILDKLLLDAGSGLTMTGLSRRLASRHPARVWADLRQDGEISVREMVQLGWIAMTGIRPQIEIRKAPVPPSRLGSRMTCDRVFLAAGAQ